MKTLFMILSLFVITACGTPAPAAILVMSSDGLYTKKATLSAAVTDADTAGKTIVVTSALTAVQSNISSASVHSWPSDRILRVENGGVLNPTTKFTGLKEARPEWFGDNTAAWQKALDTLAPVINLTPGANYEITDELTVHSNLKINGNGSTITQTTTGADGFVGTDIDNFVVDGLTMVGVAPDPITESLTDRGIFITGGSNLKITNSTFNNWGSEGIFLSGAGATGSNSISVTHNKFNNCRNSIFVYNNGSLLDLSGNIIKESALVGIFIDDVSLSDTGVASIPITNSNVRGNIIQGFGRIASVSAIATGYATGINIVGNNISDGTGTGISLTAGGASADEPLPPSFNTIMGNHIAQTSNASITLYGAQYNNVYGNTLVDPHYGSTGANAGIELLSIERNGVTVGASYNQIKNNQIIKVDATSDMDYGISIAADCNYNTIATNSIIGATTLDVYDLGTGNYVSQPGISSSGSYTPTMTGVANVATVTSAAAMYSRVDDVVQVNGSYTVAATADATPTTFTISLPIASDFTVVADARGMAADTVNNSAAISGDVAGDVALVTWLSTSTSNRAFSYSFSYRVK